MKSILSIFLSLFCFQLAFSQWVKVYSNSTYPISDFTFVNDSTGVAGFYQWHSPASKTLILFRTTNYGTNWNNTSYYTQGNPPYINRINGDTMTVYCTDASYSGSCWTSYDGGQNYLLNGCQGGLISYHYLNTKYGIMNIAGYFLLRKYNNSSKTVGTYTASGIQNFWLNSYKDFFVISGNKLYSTNDTGATWNVVSSPTVTMSKMSFSSYSVGYVACSKGVVMKSTDAGNTWTYLNTGVSQKLNDIRFKNDSLGYVVGDSGTVLKTTNGGLTWIKESFPNNNNIYKIIVLKKKAYLMSNNEIFRRDVDTCSVLPYVNLSASSNTTCISSSGNPTIALSGNPPGGVYSGPHVTGNVFYAPNYYTTSPFYIFYSYTNSFGCNTATYTTIQTSTPTTASLTASSNSICANSGTIALTGLPPGGNYIGSNLVGSTFIAPNIPFNQNFVINYQYTSSEGCVSNANFNISVLVCVGVEEINSGSSEISIFPNPAHSEINIKGVREGIYSLYNNIGQKITDFSLNESNLFTYQLVNLPSGVYYLRHENQSFKLLVLMD